MDLKSSHYYSPTQSMENRKKDMMMSSSGERTELGRNFVPLTDHNADDHDSTDDRAFETRSAQEMTTRAGGSFRIVKSHSERNVNLSSVSEHSSKSQPYEKLLSRLPGDHVSSEGTSTTNTSVDDMGGHSSCHDIGRMNNKQRVRFGLSDIRLHNSCPIIDEDSIRSYRDEDLAALSELGLGLSALSSMSKKAQTIVLRRENFKDVTTNLFLESIQGNRLAFMEGEPWKVEEGRRVMTDTKRNPYAIIVHSLSGGGKNIFRICGTKPFYPDQRKSRDTGLYINAEVRVLEE